MRKRLVIGAIAAVVLGVVIYGFSPPKEGSVDWYLAEYADAVKKMQGQRNWFASLKAFYHKASNKLLRRRTIVAPQDFVIQCKRSEDARLGLHRLGFLAVRQFTLTNASNTDVAARVWKERAAELSSEERMFTKFSYSAGLEIEGLAKQMDKWEAAVRRADVDAATWQRSVREAAQKQ